MISKILRRFEALLPTFPSAEPLPSPASIPSFLWACTRGARGAFLVMALATAAMAAFEAYLFVCLGRLVDQLGATTPATFWAGHGAEVGWLTALLLASIVFVTVQTVVKHQTLAVNLPMRMRWNFHRLLLGQSMAFFQDEFAGRITTRLMQTALAVRDALFVLCDVVVRMLVYVVTIALSARSFDPLLSWPFVVWMLLYALQLWYFVPRLGRVGRDQADARSLMTGRITDAFSNMATVRLFSHSRRESGYVREAMQAFLKPGYGQMRLVSCFEAVNHASSVLLMLSLGATALWLWTDGQTGAGAVAAAIAMSMRLQSLSHWTMWELSDLFESVGTLQDGAAMLALPRQVVDADDATPLVVQHGAIHFEDVRFAYAQGAAPVIDGLSLSIAAGERIGLVGRSGAGKSTLINLLLRFHDLQGGRILIDGQPVSQVTQESLRASIGMVTQDTSLLHRSVADNVLYGRPDADEGAVREALQMARATEFVEQLEDPAGRRGLQAHVGERGVKLSGGQRQRIAIARVMLKNAPILVLDEATSALDSEVEAAIQESLSQLMQGKTVIAIAHRLSTIAQMDRLVVMEAGQIVEQGTHASLLAAQGVYARLWQRQSGGFLPAE